MSTEPNATLLDFQRTVAAAIMRPLTREDNMRRGADEAVALVKPNAQLTSFERLEIYARSYWSRLLDAFSEDFPGVRAVLGAAEFERMRRRYLADCPSESFTMRNLGSKLVPWLRQHAEVGGVRHALAAEMAQLEWAEIESFDAAAHEPLGAEDIAALTPESTLHLQPHLRLLEATHEVDHLLLALRTGTKHGGPPRQLSHARIAAARSPQTVYLAVHRPELMVHYKRLDAEMFHLLAAIRGGHAMGEAVELAYANSAMSVEECQQHIQQSFAVFAALGWFARPAVAEWESL